MSSIDQTSYSLRVCTTLWRFFEVAPVKYFKQYNFKSENLKEGQTAFTHLHGYRQLNWTQEIKRRRKGGEILHTVVGCRLLSYNLSRDIFFLKQIKHCCINNIFLTSCSSEQGFLSFVFLAGMGGVMFKIKTKRPVPKFAVFTLFI